MKKLLLSALLIFGTSINLFSQIIWTAPFQIDDYAGTYPNVEFDNSGHLYVIRYDIQRDSIVIKSELTPQGVFGNGKNVTNTGTNTAIHFSGSDTINLLVSKFMAHVIYRSIDGGQSYTQVKTVPNSDNISSPNTMAGYFVQEGNQLRLVYSFVHYNPVVGDKPQMFQILRNGDTWDASGVFIADGSVAGLFENQASVTSAGTRGTFNSSDNGSFYTEINPGVAMSEQLRPTGTDSWNGRIYMIHSYTGMSNELLFTTSDDNGVTWTTPQTNILSSIAYINYPKISAKGDTIVAAWLEDPSPQMGINGYKLLKACYSLDGGATFSAPDTLFYGTDYNVIKTSYDDNRADFDIANYGDRFVVGYSTVLNNLANNQHTFIRELSFPVPDPVEGTDVQTACGSYTWIDGNTYTESNNTATYTYIGGAANGADSIVTLDLTILDPSAGVDAQTACGSYTWIDGNAYDASNNSAIYSIIGGAANGCDSIVTLNLTIINVNIGVTLNGEMISSDADGAVYQWLDCNNNYAEIPGETNQIYAPGAEGNYAVEVTENGCTDTSGCFMVSTWGLSDITFKDAMNIFPNPTKGKFTIQLNRKYDFLQIRILSLTGIEISKYSFYNTQKIDVEATDSLGVYFIEVSDGINQKAVFKLIREE